MVTELHDKNGGDIGDAYEAGYRLGTFGGFVTGIFIAGIALALFAITNAE